MSLFLEHKYVSLLGPRFGKFAKKSTKLYNCRCPICLDSKKNKNKARGYFYLVKNRMRYKCHNCGASHTLAKMLERFDPALYRRYAFERMGAGENGHSDYKKPDEAEQFKPLIKKIKSLTKPKELLELDTILKLPDEHYAKQYVASRKIPRKFWNKLHYTNDFKGFVEKLTSSKYENLKPNDDRLVIPFYTQDGRLLGVQGRALGQTRARYITIKVLPDEPKIYGMERVDFNTTFYIAEGPIDSMFIPNCIAAGGADIPFDSIPKNGVFVFDNEPRNVEIVDRMKRVVKLGYSLFVWPDTLLGKDINAAVLLNVAPAEIMEIIEQNTFKGLQANNKIMSWRRR